MGVQRMFAFSIFLRKTEGRWHWRQLEFQGVNGGSEGRQRERRTDSEIRLPVMPVLKDATTAESDSWQEQSGRVTTDRQDPPSLHRTKIEIE